MTFDEYDAMNEKVSISIVENDAMWLHIFMAAMDVHIKDLHRTAPRCAYEVQEAYERLFHAVEAMNTAMNGQALRIMEEFRP